MPPERSRGMKSFFEPKSVAVAGVSADPNKMGSIIFANLLANRKKGVLKAEVYALNPAHDRIGDEPCYPSVGALPQVPELLVVAVPEALTPELMRTAAGAGVKASVVVTSGYSEAGRGDVEKAMGRDAAKHGMRVLGPNTIGLQDTRSGVDTLFLRPTKELPDGSEVVSLLSPLEGGVAIITQSGHLGETVSAELASNGVGIRALVGTGNQLDVSVEDVMQYFADDPHTKVMAVYLEGLRDGRRFMEVASYASRRKPVVVFKVGKTDVGARAALTHTASLVGNYDVYRAAFRRSGVIEAGSLQELVDFAIALSMLPPAAGDRLAIVTNAGGVGAIAADEAQEVGLHVNPLGGRAREGLRSAFRGEPLVPNASFGNPVDLTASATSDDFCKAARAVLGLRECDAVVLMPTHQAPAIGYDVGRRLAAVAAGSKKPVVVSVIGRDPLAGRIHGEFMSRGVPSFPTPERAVRALAAAVAYGRLRVGARGAATLRGKAPRRFAFGSGPLETGDVSRLLRAYGIEEPDSVVVRSKKGLRALAGVRYPVACKLLSEGLLHKSDAGGVLVGVPDAGEARAAFARFSRREGFRGMLVQEMVGKSVELILGGTRDPAFGPVVVYGLGGVYAEVLRDYVLEVAPADAVEVRESLRQGRIGKVIAGYRGGPRVDLGRLARVISSFSRIMVENPGISQMEINPLMAGEEGVLAVDARVIVGDGP